jgi:hypothetical protein
MTREEYAKFVAQCREIVLGLGRLEAAMSHLNERLSKDEQKAATKEILEWLGTTQDLPPNAYTREWARELLAQFGALATYDTYDGSPDSYIV